MAEAPVKSLTVLYREIALMEADAAGLSGVESLNLVDDFMPNDVAQAFARAPNQLSSSPSWKDAVASGVAPREKLAGISLSSAEV